MQGRGVETDTHCFSTQKGSWSESLGLYAKCNHCIKATIVLVSAWTWFSASLTLAKCTLSLNVIWPLICTPSLPQKKHISHCEWEWLSVYMNPTFPTISRWPWLAARCRGVSSPRFMTLMRAPLMMSMSTTLERPSLHAQWRGLKPWSSLQGERSAQ